MYCCFSWGKMHFWAQPCNYISCNELLIWDLKFVSYVMYYNAMVAILPFMVGETCLLENLAYKCFQMFCCLFWWFF